MIPAVVRNPYYAQSNNPDDLNRYIWNQSQEQQQDRLAKDVIFSGGSWFPIEDKPKKFPWSKLGGSWSQPSWTGWHPIIGAGSNFIQRYAQDGDMMGYGQPIGMSPFPLNRLVRDDYKTYSEVVPTVSTIHPTIVQPSPVADKTELEIESNFTPEPQQRATFVPPYSQTLMQGLGSAVKDENNVLYEEPLEIPKYKGSLHKKKELKRK